MWYVLGEIWLWMILALVLGLILGFGLGQLRRAATPTDDLEAELAQVRSRLRTRDEELAAANAQTPVAALAAAAPVAALASGSEPADGAADEVAADAVGDAADAEPDDLKEISGVGPKLESVLHAAGITRFKQVADLDEAGVAELDAKLEDFEGRIEREDWVQQAADLHAKKYG